MRLKEDEDEKLDSVLVALLTTGGFKVARGEEIRVHFAQRFRYPAQMYPITGHERYLQEDKALLLTATASFN